LKVHDLGGGGTIKKKQDFHTAGPLRHRWIETIATLLNGRHMESGRVGNNLK